MFGCTDWPGKQDSLQTRAAPAESYAMLSSSKGCQPAPG
jgi:hypothetical protein